MSDESKTSNFFENSSEPTQTIVRTDVQDSGEISPKSRLATSLLAYFLGTLGVHNFYLGHIVRGVVKLVLGIIGWIVLIAAFAPLILESIKNDGTIGDGAIVSIISGLVVGSICLSISGVWAFVEFILALCGALKDKNGLLVKKW